MGPTDDKPGAALRLEPGEIIGERYRVVELLGEGGMGVVYRVEHVHMRKLFALKVLHRAMLQMSEAVARFEREAVLAGSIDHPNVAAATDFGKLPDGSFFLVLELVVGKSLRELIAEGVHDPQRALGIMRGMAAGVAAAHAKGIVHRDLKPDNVMLVERDGVPDFVKVLDFGIAKGNATPEAPKSEGESGPKQLTQLGMIMGTPMYMSPEQALGQDVDARSDLYSLGVIYFELLTGAPPFQSEEALQILRHHLLTEAPPVPPERVSGVAAPLADIVKRLLAKEPSARFQTAAELLSALEGGGSIAKLAIAASAGAPAPPLGPPASAAAAAASAAPAPPSAADSPATDDEAQSVRTPSRRVLVAAASLGVLVLMAVVFVILSGRSDAPTAIELPSPASASAAATGDPAPAASASATANASALASTDDSESDTAEAASASPAAAGPAPGPGPAASPARAGRGKRGRPGRQAQPKKPGLLQPLKDLFR